MRNMFWVFFLGVAGGLLLPAAPAAAQCWWAGLGPACANPPPVQSERYYPPYPIIQNPALANR